MTYPANTLRVGKQLVQPHKDSVPADGYVAGDRVRANQHFIEGGRRFLASDAHTYVVERVEGDYLVVAGTRVDPRLVRPVR